MPMMDSRPEEVGHILVKVQEDLNQLRDKLLHQKGSSIDLTALQNAIEKTQDGIRDRTELVVNQMNNQILTLPSLDSTGPLQQQNDNMAIETTWDLRTDTRGDLGVRRTNRIGLLESRDMSIRPNQVGLHKNSGKKVSSKSGQMAGVTPGQHTQQNFQHKIVKNPYNAQNRTLLQDSYDIQLPLIPDKSANRQAQIKVITGSNVEPLARLPAANRKDASLVPPPISEDDAKKGILSLIERGLIPPAAELTLEPPPVRHNLAQLHDPSVRDERGKPPPLAITDGHFNTTGVILDSNLPPDTRQNMSQQSPVGSTPSLITPTKMASPKGKREKRKTTSAGSGKTGKKAPHPSLKTYEMPFNLQPLPPPTTPASGEFKSSSHRFAIQHGKTRDQSHEYQAFKQHYCLSWGGIVSMLKHLEKLMTNYAVPIAFINGDRLADLSLEFELEHNPTVDDLLTVVVNREDVEAVIKRPGRRFMGPNGDHIAATKVQSLYRMYRDRKDYLSYRQRKWAAGVIVISWIMSVKMSKIKNGLKQTRMDQLEGFRRRSKTFAQQWDRIKHSRRVIIHLPSLGYSQKIRDTIQHFPIRQNTQMARLCDIKDPNVDVIYISPLPVSEEKLQYYSKLLGLRAAIDTGNVEDQGDVSSKYKIIVPDGVTSFPAHRMCLGSHLWYSPQTLRRLKNLIRGRDAYIVPGVPHKDDVAVADYLGVPMLSPEPDIAQLYSTKSGCKRIFASAGVKAPPGEYDVYSLPQLNECLAQLVTEHLEVKRWLFKLDDEFDGRGIAYCDIADHLPSYAWACKEAARYGDKWSKKWAQEAAGIKIHSEIAEVVKNHSTPCNKTLYPTWEKYLEAFLSLGGVIEACPPSESVTALTVDMLIEPNGKISIINCGDQIHAESPFNCWGLSVPQSSVEPDIVNEACLRIADACKTRGVIGYFSIDFVTFIDGKTMDQLLWAVDLNLSYGDSTAMSQLMDFTTNGHFDSTNHIYEINRPKKEEKKRKRRWRPEEEEEPQNTRFAVMSTRLLHTNLAVVHYSVFFQMCRAHGIGYDIKEKQGTLFTLIDSFNRDNMGMITLGDNLQGTLATFARNLSVIHQEISAPNMQGETNFKYVIEDIEGILGTTIQNDEALTNKDDAENDSNIDGSTK
ncbi:unnamed protein product [Owenia fusiformis]|uniref:IQCH-like ATP-grasp domain-containing protein n=1 Tax=Owenia fusiformis TaxID=6347 RepID=A0A8J1XTK1_OWEFU|nr:unnamed protein product [Owenia fusiformis]